MGLLPTNPAPLAILLIVHLFSYLNVPVCPSAPYPTSRLYLASGSPSPPENTRAHITRTPLPGMAHKPLRTLPLARPHHWRHLDDLRACANNYADIPYHRSFHQQYITLLSHIKPSDNTPEGASQKPPAPACFPGALLRPPLLENSPDPQQKECYRSPPIHLKLRTPLHIPPVPGKPPMHPLNPVRLLNYKNLHRPAPFQSSPTPFTSSFGEIWRDLARF
jgi:hypothetical protein